MSFIKKIAICAALLGIWAPSAMGQAADSTATPATTENQPQAAAKKRLDYTLDAHPYVVRSVRVMGTKINDSILIAAITGIVPKDSIMIPGEHLTIAAKKLWDLRMFADVKVNTEFPTPDSVDVIFKVKERAKVLDWQFDQLKKNQQKDLIEKLRLRRGSELSDYLMSTAIRLIREYYNEKGFRNAIIDYRLEADSIQKGAVNVHFAILPGVKQRIKEIKIEGVHDLKLNKVAAAMKKTKKISINIFADNKFKDKDFPEDLVHIEDYLHSKGYRDAVVTADSTYQITPKHLGIWINVDQGKKYYFRNVAWLGNSIYKTDFLNEMLAITKGDTYDSETMHAKLGINGKGKPGALSVSSLYQDDGYLAFNLEPFETVIGDSVDVEVRMVEGKQFRINRVDFDGNTRTNDHVIRREMQTLPGDLYSQSLLLSTYQRLATMGQFDAQSFAIPSIIPNPQTETVDLKYSLKEAPNDQFELSVGWGAGMFIASVGVNFTNVSLRKFFDPKAWRPYPVGDNQTIGIKVQSNGTYYQAFSVNFMEPWLGGRKPTGLNVSFYTSKESNAYYWGDAATRFFGTIGGSVSISKRLSWPDPYFTLTFGLQMTSYKMQDWDYFLIRNGRSNTLGLNIVFARNSVDDPYQYPSSGSNFSVGLTITPPYSLFDGKDYSKSMPEQERYKWIEYHKWRLNAQWFFPLSRDRKLVLMTKAQFGYLGAYNKNKPSPFEGFQMGGDGLAGYNIYGVETVGLRGYDNSSLTPYASSYGLYANIFSKYTIELRYPIVRQGSTLVYALAFAEAGNAFTSLEDFKPFELKKAAGVGLRINLPVLGMLGVDWGYGFDDTIESPGRPSGSKFHFSMGIPLN